MSHSTLVADPHRTIQKNAYQVSMVEVPTNQEVDDDTAQEEMAKDFQEQSLALGAAWIIAGVLGLALLGFGFYHVNVHVESPEAVARFAGAVVLSVFSWSTAVILGIQSIRRRLWAVRLGLLMTYLHLLVPGGIVAIILHVIVILQAHRVLRWGKKLRTAPTPSPATV